MLSKEILARVNALSELRDRYGDNLVDRFVAQFGYVLEEHRIDENDGSVLRCLSEEDHRDLYGINFIRDGYIGWMFCPDVEKFATHCKEDILREIKEFSLSCGEHIGRTLERITGQDDIILWLLEDCLDNDFGEVNGTDKIVSCRLGYWIGQELVSAYQDYYYELVNDTDD